MNRQWRLVIGIVAALLLAEGVARADSNIQVQLIQAEKGDEAFVAPELKGLSKTFKRFNGFNRFSLVDDQTVNLKLGENKDITAPGGKTVSVSYRGISKGFIKLRFKLGELEMNVRVHNGGIFFHGGYSTENARIIVAIRAKSDVDGEIAPEP